MLEYGKITEKTARWTLLDGTPSVETSRQPLPGDFSLCHARSVNRLERRGYAVMKVVYPLPRSDRGAPRLSVLASAEATGSCRELS